MTRGNELEQAARTRDYAHVNTMLDRHLYRLLFEEPENVHRTFALLPLSFYEVYPRQTMARAIAASAGRATSWLDAEPLARYRAWARRQAQPAARDLIALHDARLRELMATGWYAEAADVADRLLALIASHPADTDAFEDLAPAPLIHCGVVHLTIGDTDKALRSFRDAEQWATLHGEHPIAQYARDYTALGYALSSRHREAAALLKHADGDARDSSGGSGTIRGQYAAAGVLAEALITIGSLQMKAADALLSALGRPDEYGELGWFVVLARAKAAWWSSNPHVVIQDVESYLLSERARTAPDTAPGTSLRAELASLYQAVGDLRTSAAALRTPGLVHGHPGLVGPMMRQQLLLGRPRHALTVLRDHEIRSFTPVQTTPWGALMHGVVQHALTGDLPETNRHAITSAMNYHRAYFPLLQAPPAVQDILLPALDLERREIPSPFRYRDTVSLTRRELEILAALSSPRTLDQIAADLHVSPNTIKTHTRGLYRKLRAQNREEATLLGDQYLL